MKTSHLPSCFNLQYLVNQSQLQNIKSKKDEFKEKNTFVTSYIKSKSPKISKLSTFAKSLRGGGCGATKKEKSDTEKLFETMKLPKNFLTNFQHHTSVIINKAQIIMSDQYSYNDVQISIQWFHYNNEYLNIICQNQNYVKSANELFQTKFEELLRILPSYLRGSSFLCYRIIQIANEILRIIYSNQLYNEKREMDVIKQQLFLQQIEEFKNQIETESAHIWKTEIQYEITLIEIMLMNCNTNSQEGNQLLTSFLTNLVQSAIAMSPTDDLIPSMIDGAKYLLKAGYEKVKYPIEVYETYYFFQSLKWQIIAAIKSNFSILNQIQQLISGYKSYIAESNNWIVHYCWVQMICDLLSYRVVLNKQMLSNDSNLAKLQENWSCLLQKKIIKQLPYDSNEAVLQLYSDFKTLNSLNWSLLQVIQNQGKVQQFQLFNETLMQEKFYDNIDIWEVYCNFKFKQPLNQKRSDDSSILQYNQDFMSLKILLDQIGSQQNQIYIIDTQISDIIQKLIQSSSSLQIRLYKNDLNFTLKKQQNTIVQLLYTFQIVNHYIKREFFLLSLIQNSTKPKDEAIFSTLEIFVNKHLQQMIVPIIEKLKGIQNYYIKLEIELETLEQENKSTLQTIQYQFEQRFLDEFIEKLKEFIIKSQNFRNITKLFFQKEKKQLSDMLQLSFSTLIDIPKHFRSDIFLKVLWKEFENTTQEFGSDFVLKEFQLQIKTKILFSQIFVGLLKFELTNYMSIQEKINDEMTLLDIQENQKSQEEIEKLKTLVNDALNNLKVFLSTQELQQEGFSSIWNSPISKILVSTFQQIKLITGSQNNCSLKQKALTLISNLQHKVVMYFNNESSDQKSQQIQFIEEIEQCVSKWNDSSNQETKSQFAASTNNNFQQKQNNNDNKNILSLLNNTEENLESLYDKLSTLQASIQMIQMSSGLEQNEESLLNKQNNYQQLWIYLQNQLIGQIKLLFEEFKSLQNFSQNDEKNQTNNTIQFDAQKVNQTESQQNEIELKNTCLKEENLLFILNQASKWQDNPQITLNHFQIQIIESLHQVEFIERSFFQFGNDYKVRECYIVNLMKIQACVNEELVIKFVQKQMKQMWISERDESVRSLLKNKELLEMQRSLFSKDLKSFTNQIKQEMKERLEQMKNLEQEIIMEGNEQQRSILQNQLSTRYEEMDSYIENISDMSAQMNISLLFLKEISKDVKQIKNKIDALQETVNKVVDDVRKLRGKKYDELLSIRKQKVLLQTKITELDSVYIPLRTIEYDVKGGKVINQDSEKEYSVLLVENYQDVKAKQNFEGEINEFIWDDSVIKDVLLLKGPAGSGKSRAARKIEEFLWKLHNSNQSKWVPIYVSLPSLKNPKYNLFEQAMESEYYNFDLQQTREFKEAIQKKQEQVVFILDSYDEMKQNCIQSNLISTNKLIQDFGISDPGKYIKFIITTRDEILNFIGYRTWFCGTNLGLLKEVELKSFDEDQIETYLKKYVELSVKRKIRNLYEFITQIQGKTFDLEEFQKIWLTIQDIVVKCNQQLRENESESLFQNKEEELIIERIKQNQTFKYLKKEQIITLRKDLQSIWSYTMFQKSIKNINIDSLLSNPFMLEIVVQVLPDMIKKQTGSAKFKKQFTNELGKLLQQAKKSKYQIQLFANKENLKSENVQFEQNIAEKQEEINKIVDNLESLKFFQNYSLIDKIIIEDQTQKITLQGKSSFLIGDHVQLVAAALKMKSFTVYEFYDAQVAWKNLKCGKLLLDVLQFSQSLALDLTINQQTQVSYKQKGKLKLNFQSQSQNQATPWEDQYFNDQDENNQYKKLIRSCVLLTIKGTSFAFIHKSLQEFFVAKFIVDQLESMKLKQNQQIFPEDQELLEYSLYNQNYFNISKEGYMGVIKLLKEQLETMQQIDEKLIEIVKLSKETKFIRSASNSIFLLSHRETFLGGLDLISIQLKNTNLYGLSFFGSNLEGSEFDNVVIDSCNFNFCNLKNTKWNQIICKEKPYMEGHKDSILLVIFSNDGELLATGGSDKLIIIWDVNNFKKIVQIIQHEDHVTCINFYQNNQKLVTAGEDGLIFIFNIQNLPDYQMLNCLKEHVNPVVKILFSENEVNMYSVDSTGYVIIWNSDKISEDHNFVIGEDNSEIKDIVFNSTGDYLFAIDKALQRISCYDVQTKISINFIEMGDFCPKKLVLSRNDVYLATLESNTNQLIIWDVSVKTEFRLVYFYENIQKIDDLDFSPNNKLLSTIGNDIVLHRNLSKLQIEYATQYSNCDCIALSQVEGLYAVYLKNTIYLVDLFTHQIMNTIETDKVVLTIQFSQFNDQIATGNKDNSISVWDTYSFKQKIIVEDYFKNQMKLTLSDDMKLLLRFDSNHIIVSNIEQAASYQNKKQQNIESFDCFAVKYSGFNMALGNYYTLKLIDLENPEKESKRLNFDGQVKCLSYSQDSSILLIGLENGFIYLHKDSDENLEEFTQAECGRTIKQLALSNNNQFLCAATYCNLYVWNINEKEQPMFKKEIDNLTKLNFSYFNEILAVCFENKIMFYCLGKLETYLDLNEENKISDIAFSPYTNYLGSISVGENSEIILHNSTTQKMVKKAQLQKEHLQTLDFINSDTLITATSKILRVWKISDEENITLKSTKFFKKLENIFVIRQNFSIGVIYNHFLTIYKTEEFCDLHVLETEGYHISFDISHVWDCLAYNISNQVYIMRLGGIINECRFENETSISSLAFSQDNKMLAICGNDNYLQLFNIQTQQIEGKFKLQNTIKYLYFSKDNEKLVCIGRNLCC